MAVLCDDSVRRPVRYSVWSPSMMKMLKSSPTPKMKVETMMLTTLNSMPKKPMNPKIISQLTHIGRNEMTNSSKRP